MLDGNGQEIGDAAHIGNKNPFRYRSYYFDTETGLYYLKSRYYDPEICRFITIDDISYIDITQEYINSINLYAYCFNNPINTDDENGNLPRWLKWLIGGLAFVGALVLTGLTGGALAPVVIGMAVSVVGGGLIQGTINAINGGSFWQGFLDGAADGALWGGIFALGGATFRTLRMFIRKFGGENLARNLSMRHNKAFIERMMKWGIRIVDFGIDINRQYRSFYYLMETIVTNGYKFLDLRF